MQAEGTSSPVLQVLAGSSRGRLDIAVINDSPSLPVKAEVDLAGLRHGQDMLCTLLDGPSALAYNSFTHPEEVTLTTHFAHAGGGSSFWWWFPAHSVTLLQLSTNR